MKHFAGSYFVIKLILFCSQFAYEGWHQQLAGGAVADAILDRIIPGSYKLEIQGSVSMRQRITESEEKNESKTKAWVLKARRVAAHCPRTVDGSLLRIHIFSKAVKGGSRPRIRCLWNGGIFTFTVVRKNWLFSTSPKGAEASACVYSIIETCKANNIDPEKYLIYLFTRMPNEERLKGETVLEKYMPWNPAMQESCK